MIDLADQSALLAAGILPRAFVALSGPGGDPAWIGDGLQVTHSAAGALADQQQE